MADSTIELLTAILAKLKADAAVGALIGDHIYDRVPDGIFDSTDTYAKWGFTDGEPFDGDAMYGWRLLLTIEVWSRTYGRLKTEQTMAAIHAALHDQPLTLSTQVFGYGQEVAARQTIEQDDGVTTLGRMRWEFITTD